MPPPDADATTQNCPACGVSVDLRDAEPLARVTCAGCGEKFRVDRTFDHFVLLETLGAGGMGSVYKARDTRLDRLVALKILRTELSAQPGETARLEQEARVTAAVSHPNVVQVFSSGNDHKQFYLVMELVDFGSLDDLIEQHGKLPEAQVLEIGLQIAQGLQAAQEKGLIHRDIKPANILFANESSAKIGDFGLAVAAGQKADAQNEIWGTPYYVAPERLNNEPEDFRSDIFSLGATLFHAIAGRPPIEGESTSATELRQLKSQPPVLGAIMPELSRLTDRAINRMIAPDPRMRFQSYAEAITALRRARQALEPRGYAERFRSRALIATLLVVVPLVASSIYLYRSKTKVAPDVPPAAGDMNISLKQLYDDARRQLIAGKYDVARTAFTKLGEQAGNRQPILNWIRLHRGLASLLRGYSTQARQAFEEVEKSGRFSAKPQDAELAKFFVETAHTLAAPNPIPAAGAPGANPKTPQALAIFLFAMKDWQQGDFANGASLLEQFARSESTGALGWINDYKPLAQKYLNDYRVYAEGKARPQNLASVAGLKDALSAVRATASKIQIHSRISEVLKDDEALLAKRLADEQKSENQALAQATREAVGRETPIWEAALAAYRVKVAAYDFTGAANAVTAPQLTEAALKTKQQMWMKKAAWLVEWKTQFISDFHRSPVARPVSDTAGIVYKGIAGADPDRIALTLPYGATSVSWAKVTPKSLLESSTAFIVPGAPDTPDRQWRCAVFASETGQVNAARDLGDAAAKAKPEYREFLSSLSAAR